MEKKVLFVILDAFADYEYPYLASALQGRILDKTSPYEVATVSLTKEPVKSIGGFTVLPDYSIDDCPSDYAALMLIGANDSWRKKEAAKLLPLVKQALADGKIVGAICDATVFLGMNGFLDNRKHTSNTLESLQEGAPNYSGQSYYQNEQAVRDGNLITANGTAALEFMREALHALRAYSPEYVEENYRFFKLGFVEILKSSAE